MYCPVCFNNTLKLTSRGVVHLVINGKQMAAGRFLFNIEKDKAQQSIQEDLTEKIDEFFNWYVTLKNRGPIEMIELCSSDVVCEHGCKIPLNKKLSVIDLLVDSAKLKIMLNEVAAKYNLQIQLKTI